MTSYTRLGSGVWDWEPFIVLGPHERCLWLALYTSREAKRVVPGLFHGSVTAMADAARMQPTDVLRSLDLMLDMEMVEYDQRNRVLRLVQLPDAGEYPDNAFVITGWWKKFQDVPACSVRDAHVPTIRWILDQGAIEASRRPGTKNRTGKPRASVEEEWELTFGTVQIPPPRRRGVRRFADALSDTGTTIQPSLFGSTSPIPPTRGSSDEGTEGSKDSLASHTSPPSEASSGSLLQNNKNNDVRLSRDSLEKEREGEKEGEGEIFFSSPERGIGGEVPIPPKPHLALVPMPTAVSVTDMLTALADAFGGKFRPDVREGLQDRLQALANELGANGQGIDDVRLAANWLASGRGAFLIGQIPGDPHSRLSAWVADRTNLVDAIAAAKEHQRISSERLAMLEQSKAILGGKP